MTRLAALCARQRSQVGAARLAINAGIVGGIGLAIGVTSLVIGNETQYLDEMSLLALRRIGDVSTPIGPTWLLHVVMEVNSLGSVTILALFTVLVTIYLLLSRMNARAAYLLISILGAWAISNAIKFAVARPRPAIVPHLMAVYDPSYPSGHAMMSAVTYLTAAALLSQVAPTRAQRRFLFMVAILLTLAVGLCRIYLGVHYPTDVLAGWCLGATWVLCTYKVGGRLLTTGVIRN